MNRFFFVFALFFMAMAMTLPAAAAESAPKDAVFELTFKNNKIEPAELVVPAGQKLKLRVVNADATAEEFESHDLKLEKIIPGNSTAMFNVRALKPGEYVVFGEFHEQSARGKIIAK